MSDEEKERDARKQRLMRVAREPCRTREVKYVVNGKEVTVIEDAEPHGRRKGYIFGKGFDPAFARDPT